MFAMSDADLAVLLEKLDGTEVIEGDTEINGLRVSVSQDAQFHSNQVVQHLTLLDYNVQLKRDGHKEIAYDSWVDTNWHSWELIEN